MVGGSNLNLSQLLNIGGRMGGWGGEVNFNYLPQRGESEKLKKGGGSMLQGYVFLRGGWGAATFPI